METERLLQATAVMEEDEAEEMLLKRRIACHPMFGLLKDAHLSCIKVCLGEGAAAAAEAEPELDATTDHSDLDLFMEAYCLALMELKKAIEEPMQEASSFLEFMHFLLEELTTTPTLPVATPFTIGSLYDDEEEEEAMSGCSRCELDCCGSGGTVEAVSEEMGELSVRD